MKNHFSIVLTATTVHNVTAYARNDLIMPDDIVQIKMMNTDNDKAKSSYEKDIGGLDIYESYKRSPYRSIKHSSYFQVYAELLDRYRDKEITFVEIGVLNGGSLFMWRDYFGPKVRIIGIDFNPMARRWENDGFEIFIGSQSDPLFWKGVFSIIGDVDIILDDGGHTYEQQIVTAHECIPRIRDGGLLIVEDTHTSYFKGFGYPSKYSFIEWTKRLIDNINSRFPAVKVCNLPYKNSIFSISFYESIVCFKIQRDKCFDSVPTSNDGRSVDAEDFSFREQEERLSFVSNGKSLKWLKKLKRSIAKRMAKSRISDLIKYF